jgi:hypothetical protein
VRVTPTRSVLLVVMLAIGSAACERYELPNSPSNGAFGRLEASFSPAEARLVGRSSTCPTSQPFLWTHRLDLRETGGVAVTVAGWQANEAQGNNVFVTEQRQTVAALNQCGPVTDGRISANGTACGEVTFCGSTVGPGRRIEHKFFTVDANGVPNTTTLSVPLATQ